MSFLGLLVGYIAPAFLVTSPLTSYADQIYSIHKNRSSIGFSLDVPLLMLTASILRIYYWFGANFETSLFVQSIVMVGVQLLLLKVALDYRPGRSPENHQPFTQVTAESARPYNFWQWKTQRPYWEFLAYFSTIFGALQLFFGESKAFVSLIGYLALGIEATLPIPQVITNYRNRSCKGFRVSVIIFWLLGDCMKGIFFAYSNTPLVFKLCGVCQFGFDLFLGYQYLKYGDGTVEQIPMQRMS